MYFCSQTETNSGAQSSNKGPLRDITNKKMKGTKHSHGNICRNDTTPQGCQIVEQDMHFALPATKLRLLLLLVMKLRQ
jgi:hypothetical protein